MKYLIAGLGNIGEKYLNTRHNIGFNILDSYCEISDIQFSEKRHACLAKDKYKGRTLVLIKPTTFVNLSGKAINYWLAKEKIPLSNLLVILDDVSLPFGTLRIRRGGGDGGHNGLKSIIDVLGNKQFARLRFGIGNNYETGKQVDYVLGKWNHEENKLLKDRIEKSREIIKSFVSLGIEQTMNLYNNK